MQTRFGLLASLVLLGLLHIASSTGALPHSSSSALAQSNEDWPTQIPTAGSSKIGHALTELPTGIDKRVDIEEIVEDIVELPRPKSPSTLLSLGSEATTSAVKAEVKKKAAKAMKGIGSHLNLGLPEPNIKPRPKGKPRPPWAKKPGPPVGYKPPPRKPGAAKPGTKKVATISSSLKSDVGAKLTSTTFSTSNPLYLQGWIRPKEMKKPGPKKGAKYRPRPKPDGWVPKIKGPRKKPGPPVGTIYKKRPKPGADEAGPSGPRRKYRKKPKLNSKDGDGGPPPILDTSQI